jgi:hypothetical protein
MIDNEEGCIAVNSTRSYGKNHSCQGMKAVVNGRRVIPSIMSLFLSSAKKVGSLPGSSPASNASRSRSSRPMRTDS